MTRDGGLERLGCAQPVFRPLPFRDVGGRAGDPQHPVGSTVAHGGSGGRNPAEMAVRGQDAVFQRDGDRPALQERPVGAAHPLQVGGVDPQHPVAGIRRQFGGGAANQFSHAARIVGRVVDQIPVVQPGAGALGREREAFVAEAERSFLFLLPRLELSGDPDGEDNGGDRRPDMEKIVGQRIAGNHVERQQAERHPAGQQGAEGGGEDHRSVQPCPDRTGAGVKKDPDDGEDAPGQRRVDHPAIDEAHRDHDRQHRHQCP